MMPGDFFLPDQGIQPPLQAPTYILAACPFCQRSFIILPDSVDEQTGAQLWLLRRLEPEGGAQDFIVAGPMPVCPAGHFLLFISYQAMQTESGRLLLLDRPRLARGTD